MSRLPKPRKPHWIVVATGSYLEATIISGRLSSFGIPNYIHRESVGMVLGLSIGLGEAQVVVPEIYYEAALMILEPDDSTAQLPDGNPDEDLEDADE
ncbi:MAG: hypothetical protein CUN49_01305 [Candidatus Thermofonsia Clade 1 bacterium]|uniref:Uncharacterized protein n=1 Tax=Candidatus Thermofonsia Clade 1 bacterium TaxID=2364210 RepID=A0A2M8PI49_9CHLR|nr:MAG: hypothetical protein CUN49_01305 [Candidatus Thermofonsia Clade 1 bacterium]RMF52676.1 MAG: hypothetical protein D6749_04300 [Chloroflexota bacterium]